MKTVRKIEDIKIKFHYGLLIFLSVSLCSFALFYEFAVFFAGAAGIGLLFWAARDKRQLVVPMQKITVALMAFFVFLIGTCFYGIDRGQSVVGVLRALACLVFFLLSAQLNKSEKETVHKWIANAGAAMVVFCSFSYLIEPVRDYFWQAGRLGGTFQYSNSCALFFLLGLICCIGQLEAWGAEKEGNAEKKSEKEAKEDAQKPRGGRFVTEMSLKMFALAVGIMLTGSRSVFVMLALLFLYVCFRNKRVRLPLFLFFAFLLIFSVLYALLSGDFQTFGRFLTMRAASSTLLGRLLYWRDAFFMIVKYPFGLGRSGSYYLQGAMQTGVYQTMFVHNEFLQVCLDGGLICGLLFFYALIGALRSKDIDRLSKLMMAAMAAHSLFDFDFQYFLLTFIFFMQFPMKKGKRIIFSKQRLTKNKKLFIVAGGLTSACFLYFAAAFLASYCGNASLALRLYPLRTDILTEQLEAAEDMQTAEELADDILAMNAHVSLAYDAKALVAALKNDYDEMIDCKEKAIS